jgi:hypothetical protein
MSVVLLLQPQYRAGTAGTPSRVLCYNSTHAVPQGTVAIPSGGITGITGMVSQYLLAGRCAMPPYARAPVARPRRTAGRNANVTPPAEGTPPYTCGMQSGTRMPRVAEHAGTDLMVCMKLLAAVGALRMASHVRAPNEPSASAEHGPSLSSV